MSRYGDPNRSVERLQSDALVADQVIEDLSRALEDSERVCDRYREALAFIERGTDENWVRATCHDAMWTKVSDR